MPTAQSGKDIYIQDGTGTGAIALGGQQSASLSVNGKTVDVTSRDSSGYREMLSGGGITSVDLSGNGIITDGTFVTDLLNRSIARTLNPYTITFSNGDKIAGSFQLTKFEAKGQHDGVQEYSLQLESSGSMTVTPV